MQKRSNKEVKRPQERRHKTVANNNQKETMGKYKPGVHRHHAVREEKLLGSVKNSRSRGRSVSYCDENISTGSDKIAESLD